MAATSRLGIGHEQGNEKIVYLVWPRMWPLRVWRFGFVRLGKTSLRIRRGEFQWQRGGLWSQTKRLGMSSIVGRRQIRRLGMAAPCLSALLLAVENDEGL